MLLTSTVCCCKIDAWRVLHLFNFIFIFYHLFTFQLRFTVQLMKAFSRLSDRFVRVCWLSSFFSLLSSFSFYLFLASCFYFPRRSRHKYLYERKTAKRKCQSRPIWQRCSHDASDAGPTKRKKKINKVKTRFSSRQLLDWKFLLPASM